MPAIPAQIQIMPMDSSHPLYPRTLGETVEEMERGLRTGDVNLLRPYRTGFPQIDQCLGGGLRGEDLVLLAGMQNVGKTILALQMARNVAASSDALALMVCYEHGPTALLHRLICQESVADLEAPGADGPGGVTRAELEQCILEHYSQGGAAGDLDIQWLMERLPGVQRAWTRMGAYLDRLWLVRGDGLDTTDAWLGEYIRMARAYSHRRIVLFVDYAQRVPLRPTWGFNLSESARIDLVMRALKGLAATYGIPIVAVAAADAEGLRRQRIHVEDIWGPSSCQYEPDAALVLNRDIADLSTGERTVRVAIEKNRSGPSEVEFRHRLLGAHYALAPTGVEVGADESFQSERIELRRQRQPGGGPPALLAQLLQELVDRQSSRQPELPNPQPGLAA
jgi:replicative DNA helicase